MSTFYERKLMRIIKALQDDLPNVKKYESETLPVEEVCRLMDKRTDLQYAKSKCIWKVGSDHISMMGQGNE